MIALASVTGVVLIIAWLSIIWVNIPENANVLSLFLVGLTIYAPYVTGVFAVMYYVRLRQLKRGLPGIYHPLLTRGVAQIITALPPLLIGGGLTAYIVYVLFTIDGGPGSEFIVLVAGFVGALTFPVLLFGLILLIIALVTLRKSRKEKVLRNI